ncbi:CocE/NonD family hydrolase [Myceligenerans pegani]|uniref:CocE/NonD family hydrolase n=1 Tax=Myceligenerans pegani TaxID=2776917 RepID=A0ABR9MST6_9MICO|nr:CocE/NonD family hydrolase [Myceligenerans sp. TRM 65318]MBE1874121.1 CocE/NonD family hydrolase [Myceligenerans sp. TRM 65318]MBE3016393.1 CocE/NonD family hydrolase [Myceligenerans sp. TRM 65318]
MRTVTDLPYEVETVENVFIPLRDGQRVAARMWAPVDAATRPVPAVVEYIPYRKRDSTRGRDAHNHPYIAGHGYVCVRVDLRGSGDSDGVLVDEYRPQELHDAEDVIAWLAEQPWCDGNVGMMGISWGGFNSLQVAAAAPPALKAVVSASATDDLYVDNMHYMGGCLLADNLSEATVMFAFNSLPPDPAVVGDRWRSMWRERLEGSGLWLDTWLRHQRRDDYWKPASVCEDYSRVRCPVMAVGGWADGYTNAIFRLLENLDVPRKGLIGPWGHRYPHLGVPGPAIGFLQEVVRWWDHWLKGVDTGLEDEPMLRAWMQDSVPPSASYEDRPGRWVTEPTWPAPGVEDREYRFSPHHLSPVGSGQVTTERDETGGQRVSLLSPLSVGMFAGKWASYSAVPDLPYDQREEDGGALVFETEPLAEPLELLGLPRVGLEISSDRPVAQLAVRLSDVAPDGEATRVTYGVLNLTHRDGSEHPRPLEAGRTYPVTVQLNGMAQALPAGHRLRVSISTSYWPLIWPAPEPATVTITTSSSALYLPVRRPRSEDDRHRPLEPPEAAEEAETTVLATGRHSWRVTRDLATDVSTLEIVNDQGTFRLEDTGTVIHRDTREWYSFRWNDVTSVRGETRTVRRLENGADWRVEVVTRTVLTCTATDFLINAQLDAYELDEEQGHPRVYSQNWQRRIARDLV